MYKGECLNPQINKLFSELGHTDLICVCDAGLPIPVDVERIDLAWKKSRPKWLEVCKLLMDNIYIEKIFLSENMRTKSAQMHNDFLSIFNEGAIEIVYVNHEKFKEKVSDCKGVIRTGEFTPFANCIFVAGVGF